VRGAVTLIVLLTASAVIALDSEWWLSASIGGLVLFAVYHHAHQRSSAYREHWR